ncbi:MAG: hypothetical protein FRX48_06965 [Lasallia pustulata]|uniref:Beta-lactamase-related domain-containing protein n=1 Tax=Lasallia pustulata TaxID=136370 RepID=A0A5M8PKJ9_9LECA|nr:MAG: hypothetical protein FRX48_06965 [Lasallia pustulata]
MSHIESIIQQATSDPKRGTPGLVFQAVDRNGNILSSVASGLRSLDDKAPMTPDTIFWIASCTKLVTSIALMQLFEQGTADLDSADQLEEVVPEMAEVKILEGIDSNGKEIVRDKKNRITLRMLQTHTAGFGYTFFSHDLWARIGQDPQKDEFQGTLSGFQQPLEFEPGTNRAYGVNIDWVGVFIERITGQSLGAYFREHIFNPLGIHNTAFVTQGEMRQKLAGMHSRSEDGVVRGIPHPYKPARTEMAEAETFHSGGGGLLSNAPDYCQLLATLLNDGTSPLTHARLLQKPTIDQMFSPQLPTWESSYATAGCPISRPDLVNVALEDGLPLTGRQNWGLSFLLEGENLQRGSAPGLSNCWWELDRERGVGGVLLSQVLPFGDPVVGPLWVEVMGRVYAGEEQVAGGDGAKNCATSGKPPVDPLTAADPESEDESDPEDVLLQALMGEDEYKDGVSDNGKDVEEFDDETLLNSDSKGLGLEKMLLPPMSKNDKEDPLECFKDHLAYIIQGLKAMSKDTLPADI